MPKQLSLANGEIYHIVLRGIEGKLIFNDKADYYRTIHNLFEFNDKTPAKRHTEVSFQNPLPNKPRKLLVEIFIFCLMPNHIHLLLYQITDNGITNFMRKFGGGYAGYFNRRYERQGHLFQERFRAVHIKNDEQLKNVFIYIHTNSASLIDPNWKDGQIQNPEEVIKFVENYKWSSYGDYLGNKNFPSVTQRHFLNEILPSEKWREFVNDWIRYKSIDDLRDAAFE